MSFLGVARVIITAKQALVGEYVTVLQRLIDILRKVAPNPSNPNFDQYIFESISGLIRFIGATVPDSITVFDISKCACRLILLDWYWIPDQVKARTFLAQ